jgi:hypothetical protein
MALLMDGTTSDLHAETGMALRLKRYMKPLFTTWILA